MKKLSKPWEDWEIDILTEKYPELGAIGILQEGLLPKRNQSAIVMKANRLGLHFYEKNSRGTMGKHMFTEEEDNTLREYYATLGGLKIFEENLLPGRSLASIYKRAHYLKLSRPTENGKYSGSPYSAEEEKILREYYPKGGASLCQKMGLFRDRGVIRAAAFRRGLVSPRGQTRKRLYGKDKTVAMRGWGGL